ncbi:hypothetical protein B0H13DRAFT_2493443 [Mycena leptocephala]|nr:hypothetical protein B0H13DRAFT_2493443 [Mycena leptocephala]
MGVSPKIILYIAGKSLQEGELIFQIRNCLIWCVYLEISSCLSGLPSALLDRYSLEQAVRVVHCQMADKKAQEVPMDSLPCSDGNEVWHKILIDEIDPAIKECEEKLERELAENLVAIKKHFKCSSEVGGSSDFEGAIWPEYYGFIFQIVKDLRTFLSPIITTVRYGIIGMKPDPGRATLSNSWYRLRIQVSNTNRRIDSGAPIVPSNSKLTI